MILKLVSSLLTNKKNKASAEEISLWYEKKIVERAIKNKLPEKDGVFLWGETPSEIKRNIEEKIPLSDEFILVFWKNTDCWTVISSVYLLSYYSHKVTKIQLTQIRGKFEIYNTNGTSQEEIKTQSEFLIFPNLGNKKIWFPAGSTILGVMNTLLYVTKKYTKRPTGA